MEAPCLNCEARAVGCHTDCEKYLAYRREKDEERDARYARNQVTGLIIGGYQTWSKSKKEAWKHGAKPRGTWE